MTHNEIKEYFFSMIEEGKTANSIIMEGVSSEEDKEPAYSFVKKLMGSIDNLDVIIPIHEKPHLIKVEEIRQQVVGNVMMKPYGNDYKIYLIDGELLREDSQNTLLKVLEEPPSYAVFIIFVKSASSLLPTIRSRCLLLSLTHEDKEGEYGEAEMRIACIARLVPGSHTDMIISFTNEILALVKDEKIKYTQVFDIFRKVYADKLREKEGLAPQYIKADAGKNMKCTESGFLKRLSAISETEEKIKRGVNAENALKKLLLDIK